MSPHPFSLLSGKRVLVTGGTGFIGGRLVGRLALECGATVRVLLRSFARAPRIARVPVEMVRGDATSAADVERAMTGCQLVFHCVYGNQGSDESRRASTVQSTHHVAAAAIRLRVERLVHVSTVAVYGAPGDGDLDETRPRRRAGSHYADHKLAAEEAVVQAGERDGLRVAIVQPAIVYGPFGSGWTANVLHQLKTGRVILVNGGTGLCNAVYVDDVVTALLLAAVQEDAVGQAFLISGREPVTWREFYGRFEQMLGTRATVPMTVAEAEAYYRTWARRRGILREAREILHEYPIIRERLVATREGALAARLARLVLPAAALRRATPPDPEKPVPADGEPDQRPLQPLHPAKIRAQAGKVRVRIDKARRVLGFEPAVDFDRGMRLTEAWARWANLL